ncbi:MAG: chemotaxis protein CheD [Oscillospiraceae bacterium]|jgi:chemotaxis protein CheD|nr:chemotaxis protein CheD [Oscillospiraceae bacterium]MCI1990109.1 chemotaxis protein CheD [Oscillospiraceae bacterium]MCI2034488.1 chemotaxis protein CheD [Oscillospiraceae bacterium]
MSELITIGISDMKVSVNPASFVTYALGSCVGICLYDACLKVGGLAHIMLPYFPKDNPNEQIHRYADTCLPRMIRAMEDLGCIRGRITAKIAGGAKMFDVADDSAFGSIGARNIAAVKETLNQLQVRIIAEDTGLNYGRTVYFYTENGEMVVKSFAQGTRSF